MLGSKRCVRMRGFRIWSQNWNRMTFDPSFGHSSLLTMTMTSHDPSIRTFDRECFYDEKSNLSLGKKQEWWAILEPWLKQLWDPGSEWIPYKNRRMHLGSMWMSREKSRCGSMIPYVPGSRSFWSDPETHFWILQHVWQGGFNKQTELTVCDNLLSIEMIYHRSRMLMDKAR